MKYKKKNPLSKNLKIFPIGTKMREDMKFKALLSPSIDITDGQTSTKNCLA